jgi:hypothetical protein
VPQLQRAPSTTTRTAALIKTKIGEFIKIFQDLATQRKSAIIGKAECLGMCPKEQIYQRGEVE